MSMFFSGRSAPTDRSNQAFKESFWSDFMPFARGRSSGAVNPATALSVTAVLACVRVLANGVSQVPLNVYRPRAGGGSDIAKDHALHSMLHRKPNSWQTSFEFRENMLIQAALCGNFYAFKNMVRGTVREIIPFAPGTVKPDRDVNGVITYWVTAANGECREFPAAAIWHVRGPSWDTWNGIDIVKLAREAIGLAMATEDAHSKLHANGAQSSGLYSVDGTVNPEQYEILSAWINKQIAGDNRSKPLVLDRGAKWTPISQTGVDSQHLDTRRFQIEEICRVMGLMPIMIGQSDKAATYASAEQMFLAHVVHALMPWYQRLEQSMDVNLLSKQDTEDGIYCKFVSNGLMRGSAAVRADYYYKMWQMAALNPNEIRELEDTNPYEGGEIYRVQMNTVDASEPAPPAAEPAADKLTS